MTPSNMLFDKEASGGQSLAYGGNADTHNGATAAVRVRASLVDLSARSYRLKCKAFTARNANDSSFAEETALSKMRGSPYQDLLDKVAKRLE